jgi:4-hydroxy-2-oxoheptanedioate aldolase
MTSMANDFARRLRTRKPIVGYWVSSDNPPVTERIATLGYDYVCLDGQHGFLDAAATLRGLLAVDAGAAVGGTSTIGVARVASNDPALIGRALDAGAYGVIVPLVNTAEEAAKAVGACRYPPNGVRSFGPTRSILRIGPDPADANDAVACIVMIETAEGLDNVEEIAAVPGLDAVYIGPSDLGLGIGGTTPADGASRPEFQLALARIRAAAEAVGIASGLHTISGEAAEQALAAGFTFASVSNDINHVTQLAAGHLAAARRSA